MLRLNAGHLWRVPVNGGFERIALIFLGGAVVVVLGLAVFTSAPGTGPSSSAPAASAPAAGLATGLAPVNVAAPHARIDVPYLSGPVEYDLDAVAAGAPVPRGAVAETAGFGHEAGSAREWFLHRALPLALLVNEEILTERARLWDVRQKLRAGDEPTAEERLWLAVTAGRYRVSEDDLAELARRLDVVPPSIILAVVGSERRWNITASVPEAGSTAAHRDSAGSRGDAPELIEISLGEAVRTEVHALNTAPQFGPFREARDALRRDGAPLVGGALMRALPSGHSPVWQGGDALRSVISGERLDRFDAARLEPAPGPD